MLASNTNRFATLNTRIESAYMVYINMQVFFRRQFVHFFRNASQIESCMCPSLSVKEMHDEMNFFSTKFSFFPKIYRMCKFYIYLFFLFLFTKSSYFPSPKNFGFFLLWPDIIHFTPTTSDLVTGMSVTQKCQCATHIAKPTEKTKDG